MTLVEKLRYMGRQYAAGQYNRGGGIQKHYLEEAADELERLQGTLASVEEVGEVVIGPKGDTEGWTVVRWSGDKGCPPVGTKLYVVKP